LSTRHNISLYFILYELTTLLVQHSTFRAEKKYHNEMYAHLV